jgi:anti-sigma-K factor RskA
MEHNQVFEIIPAYALGALDPDERVHVEAHLRLCAVCRSELRAYQDVVGRLLIASVPQHEPPAALKQRIMRQAVPPSKSAAARTPSVWGTLSAKLYRLAPAWSLVSLVLVIALSLSTISLYRQVQRLEASERFYVIPLAGTDLSPIASGVIVIDPDGVEGTLVVDQLPLLDETRQYQLWLIRDGMRTSGGVFSVYRSGYASFHVKSEEPLSSYDAFGVTIEPFGGSPAPTGAKVLGGEF